MPQSQPTPPGTTPQTLSLCDVQSLKGQRFFVPAYQRGYRWTREQALRLLDDLLDFQNHYPATAQASPFYSLQPLVLRRSNTQPGCWDVIDGQQRLTTVLLILQAMHLRKHKQFVGSAAGVKATPGGYDIKYETREGSDKWLVSVCGTVSGSQAYARFDALNCDYSHFAEVFSAAYEWIDGLPATDLNTFENTLLGRTRFIRYIPNAAAGTPSDIFDRLNAGKIALNNAELIKALLLQKGNWQPADPRQNALALEWDSMERALQDSQLWGFIYRARWPFSYDTHIEYLFDMLKGKTGQHTDLTFFTFNQYLDDYRNTALPKDEWVTAQWNEVKALFDTLREWFADRRLYHRIGFLLQYSPTETPLTLRREFSGKRHSERLKLLDGKIADLVGGISPDRLFYKRPELSELLFLYNILLEDRRQSPAAHFSFAEYRDISASKGWDQEHVASHTDAKTDLKGCRSMAGDIIELLTGLAPDTVSGTATLAAAPAKGADAALCAKALAVLNIADSDKNPETTTEPFINEVNGYFCKSGNFTTVTLLSSGKDVDEKDFIWNFVLLNAVTNRSYGNSIFPVKRSRILRDELSVYTPVGTRNVFEKAYTRRDDAPWEWTRDDAQAYWDDIVSTLAPYVTLTKPF